MSSRNLWKVWAGCTAIWVLIAMMNAAIGNTMLVALDLVVAAFQAFAAYFTYRQYNVGE